MNIFNTLTQFVVTDKPQTRRIDASQIFPVAQPTPTPFRLRAYTDRAYGPTVGRTLYGRYTR